MLARCARPPGLPFPSMRPRSTQPERDPRRGAARLSNFGAMPLALKIILVVVVFAPLVVFGAFLIWAAIQDGRDERRSKRVTRG